MRKIKPLSIAGLVIGIVMALSAPSHATTTNIEAIVSSMSTKEKVAQMIMPSFRWSCETMRDCNVTSITPDIENILKKHNFAGVILFAQNIVDTEQTTRLIDELQRANASSQNKNGQLLIAVDQEGGYITRLAYGTNMPGNMGLGATNDTQSAYTAAKVIGTELGALGFNTDFAPVSDVNNNPANPIIGVRSFSDDPMIVGDFANSFMRGLEDSNITAALKHFPGHGDTATDTHTSMTVVDKSYAQLKSTELAPFQKLIDSGAGLIMTAHIQYPQIEDTTYTSVKDGSTIFLPATLSKKIIADVLRTDMNYRGVVVTDALDMGAISEHFDKYDVAKFAIEAGVDILLMPVETNGAAAINELDSYIDHVADMVESGEIDGSSVNEAVTRILSLKDEKGLLSEYNVDINKKVSAALATVSTKANHDKEFELAKKAITIVKNDNDALPLSADEKTLILYYYDSHFTAFKNALARLMENGIISDTSGVEFVDYTVADKTEVEEKIPDFDNIVVINSLYGLSNGAVNGGFYELISGYIDKANESGAKSILMSTQLPYDIARFTNADAIIATYLANGVGFENLESYTDNIPKYGANVIAGFYQIFDDEAAITGKLPVNIYELDSDYKFTSNILYARGHGLNYKAEENTDEIIIPSAPDTGIVSAD